MEIATAVEKFKTLLSEQPDVSPAINALTVFLEFLIEDDSATVQGISANFTPAVEALMRVESVVTSVKSIAEHFLRYITYTTLDQPDFRDCKAVLCARGKEFLDEAKSAKEKIAESCVPYINQNYNYLVHSYSRVVLHTLIKAHKADKAFHVYVTESAPDYSGRLMHKELVNAGINSTLIIDAAVGYIMEEIDIVLLGAECVTKSGGVINKVGTYCIAKLASLSNIRVYVLVENFKFAMISPVNQRDLPNELLLMHFKMGPPEKARVDYTPPSLITLFFTNVGKLTSFAVFDEMMRLYT